MSSVTTFNSVLATALMTDIAKYKNNPSAIQQVILNYLQSVTNGTVDIIDPTNPFVFLLEAGTVTSAAAINEINTLTSRLYPTLSTSMSDLYLHMSDKDYIGVFSSPSYATFNFLFNKQDLSNRAVPVLGTNYSKVTIPRNSSVSVSTYTFTLEYPIDIFFYDTGDVIVSWDATIVSPLRSISSYIINFSTTTDNTGSQWLIFNVDIDQFSVSSTQFTLTSTDYFTETVNYTNNYYYARVYYNSNASSGQWVEIKTTYTDQVFDPATPTALLAVYNGYITMSIPQVYISSGLISGTVRIDVYQTLGTVDVNFSNFTIDAFSTSFNAIDQVRDINQYTSALQNAQYFVYSTDVMAGGSNAISFSQLRSDVINNATGSRLLPITNTQLTSHGSFEGYDIVENVDLITNREFIASKNAPASSNDYDVPSLLTSVETITVNGSQLSTDSSVMNNGNNFVVTPKSLFINQNGNISIVKDADKISLFTNQNSSLVDAFNSNEYLYTPFYYLIDNSSNSFDVRVFHLDSPKVQNLNFISNNATTGYKVSTNVYTITKNDTVYTLTIICSSDDNFIALPDSQVFCQMAFIPAGQQSYAYQNGVLTGKDSNNNRIFTFTFNTNYNFDESNTLDITSFAFQGINTISPRSLLSGEFEILYIVNQKPIGYTPDIAQSKLNESLVPGNATVVTNETINIVFGYFLENLWTRSRSIVDTNKYLKYTQDIPLTYTEDVFLTDPLTGGILTINDCTATYQKLASVGDIVYDNSGNIVYKYRAGDTVLDANGNPIVISTSGNLYTFDMVFYDGSYLISTDTDVKAYVALATDSMVDWIINDIPNLEQNLLEQSIMYFYPRNTPFQISCNANGANNVQVNSKQSVTLTVYLTDTNFKNINLQTAIVEHCASIIRGYLDNSSISSSELVSLLKTSVTDAKALTVNSFLNGYDLVIINNPKDRLMFNRVSYLRPDNTISIREDLNVKFVNIDPQ